MCNVTLWRVRLTIVALETQYILCVLLSYKSLYKNNEFYTKMLLGQISITGKNKTDAGHIKCQMLHSNKIMFLRSWPSLNVKSG
jgi:hypothetical protein